MTFPVELQLDQLRISPAALDINAEPAPQLYPPASASPSDSASLPGSLRSGVVLILNLPDTWGRELATVTVEGLAQGEVRAQGVNQVVVEQHQTVQLNVLLAVPCQSNCMAGASQCVNDLVRVCRREASGCTTWAPPETCPTDAPFCSKGRCAATCEDECSGAGQRRCIEDTVDANGFQVCGQHDLDSCLDWGPEISCGAEELCRAQDSQCIPACDGEPCPCAAGETQICADMGQCKGGVSTCQDGAYGSCAWQQGPEAEDCDGLDNDCNTVPDDALIARACVNQQGVCNGAVRTCGGTQGWIPCGVAEYAARAASQGQTYQAEETLCDGHDNDCNGQIDEHASCPCQPDCAGQVCGEDNGCGQPCQTGSCAGVNELCQGGQCLCEGLECGGACCAGGQVCASESCCTPDCSGRVCGPDAAGCGVQCGPACVAGECDAQGQCVAVPASWALSMGGADLDYGESIALDSDGNTYITGAFYGPATFGSTTFTPQKGIEMYVVKVSPTGAVLWAVSFGASGPSLAVDDSGNVYLTGQFYGEATFGSTTLTSKGGKDMFVAKLSPAGAVLWAISGGGTQNVQANSIAVDGGGNATIVGYFMDQATIGSTTLTSKGSIDLFVARVSTTGSVLWAFAAGGTGSDFGMGITADSGGNAYVTGSIDGPSTFGSIIHTPEGSGDLFVAKVSPAGSVLWVFSAGGDDGGIAVDSGGNVFVAGEFYIEATFDSTTLTSKGGTDIYLAKLSPAGAVLWAISVGGIDWERGVGLAVDGSGDAFITGNFEGQAIVGNTTLTSQGGKDMFMAKVSSSGSVLWAVSAGGAADVQGEGIAVDDSGDTYVVGDFEGQAIFSSTTLTSSGATDIFVAKVPHP